METSLIGKAADFGSEEYGFESHVSNMFANSSINTINHINLNLKKKNLNSNLNLTKKNLAMIKFFKKLGLIRNYTIIINYKYKFTFLKIYYSYNFKIPTYLTVKLLSKYSKNYFISYKALNLLNYKIQNSICILTTPYGIITHHEALKRKIGGKLLLLFSI